LRLQLLGRLYRCYLLFTRVIQSNQRAYHRFPLSQSTSDNVSLNQRMTKVLMTQIKFLLPNNL